MSELEWRYQKKWDYLVSKSKFGAAFEPLIEAYESSDESRQRLNLRLFLVALRLMWLEFALVLVVGYWGISGFLSGGNGTAAFLAGFICVMLLSADVYSAWTWAHAPLVQWKIDRVEMKRRQAHTGAVRSGP